MTEQDFRISVAIANESDCVDTLADDAAAIGADGMAEPMPAADAPTVKATKPRRGAGVAKVRKAKAAKPAKVTQADDAGEPTETTPPAPTETETETVSAVSYVTLPLDFVSAALSVASTEETRHYLGGVFLQACDGEVRVVGTDGHRLFAGAVELPEDSEARDWLQAGVIVPREGLKARLALIASETEKGEAPFVRVGFARQGRQVIVADFDDRIVFRMSPVDGTFPDYQSVISAAGASLDARSFEALSANTYSGKYLKDVGTMAKVLGADRVSVFGSGGEGATVITFPEIDGAIMLLMPVREAQPVKVETARLMGPGGVKMVLAGLKANRNRLIREATESKDEGERAEKNAKAEAIASKIDTLEQAARKAVA